MYAEKQMDRLLGKLKRYEKTIEALAFKAVAELPMEIVQTDGSYQSEPTDREFYAAADGTVFRGEGIYCWERGDFTVPEALAGKKLFFRPGTKAYEGLMFVDGVPYGNFASKKLVNSHGNHYCNLFTPAAEPGRTYHFAVEYYANHFIVGTQPLSPDPVMDYIVEYHPAQICVADEQMQEFYIQLRICNEMAEFLDRDSYRRAQIVRALMAVHEAVWYDVDCIDRETFDRGVQKANEILKEVLAHSNSDSAPYVGLVGHSHMDTAWLWHRGETEKKCARTYSNIVSYMDQYPDFTFIQSSAYHSDIIRRMYPALFERMKEKIAEGRYEPNGGVWIECDCNIPSGEYMIRQFLYGQRFTREYFGYTSDCFWLPDTFGYSAALPQIMKGAGVKYFYTTKMSWNDVNEFPYDTFLWRGIDGTTVLTHLNRSHLWPSPQMMITGCMKGGFDSVKEREVSDMRLFSYGFGDGGGGPEFAMVQMAEKLADVEGLPRSSHTTIHEFMQQLEQRIHEPSVYTGELYLELHRGTLTNQHQIKRNNRKAEIALHDLEYFAVRRAISENTMADDAEIRPLIQELLVNQFHDILPGTGIGRVNEEARADVGRVLEETAQQQDQILTALAGKKRTDQLTLLNTLSFERTDDIDLPYTGASLHGVRAQQRYLNLQGEERLAVSGLTIPALGSVTVAMEAAQAQDSAAAGTVNELFTLSEDLTRLETPIYSVVFNEKGYIHSLTDKRCGRELRDQNGYALNTLLFGEDVSLGWDNWDVDIDLEKKLTDCAELTERKLVSFGEAQVRIRSTYRLGANTVMSQDVVFYADSPLVRFDSLCDWQDDHRFLRAAFDTTIQTDSSREEIQFGYLRRPNNRNTTVEKARFEVSNQKYSDLSETRYGVALLNDCKYGVSILEGSMQLSLHKGGCSPDVSGDKGQHAFSYGLYPHMGGFSAETVIRPAYAFNLPVIAAAGAVSLPPLVTVSESNVLIESIKPLEDAQRGYLIRAYEAEGASCTAEFQFAKAPANAALTNMLEEVQEEIPVKGSGISLTFRPFEIRSIRVLWQK